MIHTFRNSHTKGFCHLQIGPVETIIPEKENLLSIIWNRGNAKEIEIDGEKNTIEHNMIIPLMANNTYFISNYDDVAIWKFNREFYCIIDHDNEVSCAGFIFYGSNNHLLLRLSPNDVRKLELILPIFLEEFQEADEIQEEMLRMLLKRLIILITRVGKRQYLPEEGYDDPELDVVRKFNLLVEKHFTAYHQVQDYAHMLHKSPKTLSNVFAKLKQKSPIAIIKERVVLEAKRKLIYSSESTKEIGYALGFEEPAAFSRFFKSNVGISPTLFRSNTNTTLG